MIGSDDEEEAASLSVESGLALCPVSNGGVITPARRHISACVNSFRPRRGFASEL